MLKLFGQKKGNIQENTKDAHGHGSSQEELELMILAKKYINYNLRGLVMSSSTIIKTIGIERNIMGQTNWKQYEYLDAMKKFFSWKHKSTFFSSLHHGNDIKYKFTEGGLSNRESNFLPQMIKSVYLTSTFELYQNTRQRRYVKFGRG